MNTPTSSESFENSDVISTSITSVSDAFYDDIDHEMDFSQWGLFVGSWVDRKRCTRKDIILALSVWAMDIVELGELLRVDIPLSDKNGPDFFQESALLDLLERYTAYEWQDFEIEGLLSNQRNLVNFLKSENLDSLASEVSDNVERIHKL